jgi:MoxR-like ATPase
VINKIKSVFSNTMKKDENLKNIYLAEPKLEKLENREMICKGECGISINSFIKDEQDKNKIFEEIMSLPSLYNAFFKVLLSNEDEPILLTGSSGFKSFLAKKILSQDDIISLNQESSIEQLLGSPLFLTNIEAIKFYIYYICLICQSNNYLDYIKELEKNENIVTDDLKNKINEEIKKKNNCKIIPKTFKVSLDNLTKKLYSNKTYSERGVLLDMKLEFKPGLFLSAILGGKSLILKNLSNLPTEVLERFNELFSDQHSLTIPEDIYNTFTSKNKKELSNFSENRFHKFRVIATCPTGYSSKLSEAALSRFTVIAVDEYSEKEQKFVLKENFIKNQDINDSHLQHIITFISRFNNKFHKHFSLMQIINMVKIISYIKSQDNKYNNKEEFDKMINIILQFYTKGIIEKRNAKIIDEYNNLLIDKKKYAIDYNEKNSPIKYDTIDGEKFIISKLTGFKISSHLSKNIENPEIAFIPLINEIIDILHFGIYANIPIILEGTFGQGKQTAIQYIAECLGYDIINIMISKNTKADDLLGRISITRDTDTNKIKVEYIETKLLKAIKQNNESKKSIIVIHNLNNASNAVLDKLSSIFDKEQKDILLPNGTREKKGNFHIISIFNSENDIVNREKLPSLLINNSLYDMIRKMTNQEISNIIEKKFLILIVIISHFHL